MSRKQKKVKRTILPDPVYKDKVIAKFVNCMMLDGKKGTSEKIFYEAMDILSKKVKDEKPNKVFRKAVDNVKPVLEVKSRRIGGQNLQVPVEIRPARKEALAIRWIISNIRKKKGVGMSKILADELFAAFNNEGASVKKKEEVHKMAESNKAFAHFNW